MVFDNTKMFRSNVKRTVMAITEEICTFKRESNRMQTQCILSNYLFKSHFVKILDFLDENKAKAKIKSNPQMGIFFLIVQ